MKLYTFTPTEDMTALQVAMALKVLLVSLIESLQGQTVCGTDKLEVSSTIYSSLPNDIKSCFVESSTLVDSQNIAPAKLRVANTIDNVQVNSGKAAQR